MATIGDALTATISTITAMGALGTAAFGLVDASKSMWGGVSRIGFGHVERALAPFRIALDAGSGAWRDSLFANWLNGVAKDDQKAAAKNLIRLGMSSANAAELAVAGHVDPDGFAAAVASLEGGIAASPRDLQLIGRFNAVVDAALDAGFERADQVYRNASKLLAGIVAVVLAEWAGYLLGDAAPSGLIGKGQDFLGSPLSAWSLLVGLLAVPVAPIAKDLASSLQAAAKVVKDVP